MAAHTHVAVGYNVQIAMDNKHKLIVERAANDPRPRHGTCPNFVPHDYPMFGKGPRQVDSRLDGRLPPVAGPPPFEDLDPRSPTTRPTLYGALGQVTADRPRWGAAVLAWPGHAR